MNDQLIMPFGKHKGKTLANVPDDYLLYLYNEGIAKGELLAYIEENLEAIKKNLNK